MIKILEIIKKDLLIEETFKKGEKIKAKIQVKITKIKRLKIIPRKI